LNNELVASELSGRKFRVDQQKRSIVSGKIGHLTEFISCAETSHALAASEAERCAIMEAPVSKGTGSTGLPVPGGHLTPV